MTATAINKVTKMDPEVKQKWVARLRDLDGKEMQTNSVLRNDEGKMCCLGVLTEIAVEDGVIAPGELVPLPDYHCYTYRDGSELDSRGWYGIPPQTVGKWADFAESEYSAGGHDEVNTNPFVMYEGRLERLSVLNDEEGLSFGQIADLVEDQL